MFVKMERFMEILRKPGEKGEIQGVAPTQQPPKERAENVGGYIEPTKTRMVDRWLDWVVSFSGSEFVFFLILAGLLTWALLGIPYGAADGWQVIISDVQAIVSSAFDSLLVRQQLNRYEAEMSAMAQMQSRLLSHTRMLKKLQQKREKGELVHAIIPDEQGQDTSESRNELPPETRFGRFVAACTHVFGHIITIGLFCAAVFIWIGIGPLNGWSNEWQLYMNSASSALMVFVFSFLANIRERSAGYEKKCLDAIFLEDSALELKLRSFTDDTLSNVPVIIPAPKVNRIQRAIFYYADFVGTLVGIGILLAVIIIWIAVGPVLKFSSDWWLLIGTYAGLVGMNDGFVLRNMQARLEGYVDVELDKIDAEEEKLFAIIQVAMPPKDTSANQSLTYRMSNDVNRFCAHELTVLAGFLTIVGLIAGASAMKWTTTGQLLCNVPPNLIESFFMIILITGHDFADRRKRAGLQNIYKRRRSLLSNIGRFELRQDEMAKLN